jgi:nucleoid-associated protein YgaU
MRLWLVALLLLAGFALALVLLRRSQESTPQPAVPELPPDWGAVVLGAPSGAEPYAPAAQPAAPTPAPPPAPAPAPTPATAHEFELTVSPGQSLSSICKEHYGTASVALVEALARVNGLKSPDALRSGQKLRLPPLETLQKP